ncbi:MAG: AMP-binding protein [Planctomycetia bacterium]|nr:AMP-binding protein [Planctomycetia bacterium]
MALAYRYLWECSAFYRRKFEAAGLTAESVHGVDDLPKIPVTHREEWLTDQEEHPPWGTFSPLRQEDWLKRGWMLYTTSGTTAAQPRVFRHTTFDRDQWAWIGARCLYSMGVRNGDIAINCFGYGTSVAFWGLHYALSLMGVPVISGGGSNTERRILFINTYRPTVLLCTPSYALYLGRAMREAGHNPQESSIRTIVCAGEPGACVPATKHRLETLWHAKAHDDFGCTEVAPAPLGYTCTNQVRRTDAPVDTHLMEDVAIPEVLDPVTMQPVPEGQPGILVVSNLYSEAQPILRYVMGDWITVTTEPCSCGRTHARAVGGLQGRNDNLLKIRGLMFFPAVIEDSIRQLADVGDEFKVEITRRDSMDHVKVTIEPASPIPKSRYEPHAERVGRALKGSLGIHVEVEVVPYGTLPRTQFKAQRLFDLREKLV